LGDEIIKKINLKKNNKIIFLNKSMNMNKIIKISSFSISSGKRTGHIKKKKKESILKRC